MSYELSVENVLFKRIVIIGLGLIGASIALAAKKRKLCKEVIGLNRQSSTLMSAKETGVIDRAIENLSEISSDLNGNDLILICVPTLEFESVLSECRRLLQNSIPLARALQR